MKRYFSSLLFLGFFCLVEGQVDTMYFTTLDMYRVTQDTLGYEVTVSFIKDSKCDPEIGYVPLEDKERNFVEALKAQGINTEKFVRDVEYKLLDKNESSFVFTSKDVDELYQIINIARNQYAKVSRFNLISTVYGYKDEYWTSSAALDKGMRKAKIYAEILGYENIDLVEIDDLTNYVSFDATYTNDRSILKESHRYFSLLGLSVFRYPVFNSREQMAYSIRSKYRLYN